MKVLRRFFGGWQFRVRFKEDKVEKVPRSKYEIALRALPLRLPYLVRGELWGLAEELEEKREESLTAIREEDFDRSLLANIRFEGDKIVQDRVTPVLDVLEEIDSLEEETNVVNDYIELIHECWRNGFHEETYNFTINYGYSSDQEMVLIDPGELCFDKADIQEDLEKEKWLEKHSYTNHLSEKVKPYFEKRMREELTKDKLEDCWREYR